MPQKVSWDNSLNVLLQFRNPVKQRVALKVYFYSSYDVFGKLYKAGVRTLVSMHLSEEHFKKVKDANLNVVIAGHISSDTLGLNLLLDNIEKSAKQQFQVIACSGFTRIRRG